MKQGRHRYGEQKGELVLWIDEAGASSLRGNLVGTFFLSCHLLVRKFFVVGRI
jgi:hypothetical protein